MDKKALENVCQRIDSYQDELIDLQKNLTSMPALAPENGGEGEQKKSDYIRSYLKETLKCKQVVEYNAPDERVPSGVRPNLVTIFPGKDSSKTVWIMSHMDVVPPGDENKWNGDPWTVRVQDGKIYGRGTEDNQQGIVSSLIVAKAFLDEGVQPVKNLGLVFVSDEETGSKYGIQFVLKIHKDTFKDEDFIIIPDAGNHEGTLIEVAEKSIIWLKFRVIGKQTHGSTPDKGINSLKAAANLISKVNNLYMVFNASDPVFDPPTSTFEPTKVEPNVPNINTVPGETTFHIDCRLLPNYDVDLFHKNVERICNEVETRHRVRIEITCEQEVRAAAPTPVDAPVVKALEQAISDIKKVQPKAMGIGGGTVAAFFRGAGFNTVVWATQDEALHEPNEYVKIDNIINDAKVFAHVLLQD
ncbi:M20 family metallo-hydrolase [candidate division KSB1 bacterium]|nr:M20 family metallo-hydrolase [candidate division KSB1 bacterium]NIR70156.1 M20 family metallo-hydrolase [candidate division KSB1 bacterium]NIS28068.1 M20 family metallo-hydrolase [candidate division KSB1 bacterium]NIT74937.1 M20 family metallo-hydrolase [candidate division KSB1 bacterium]NIU28721.1 M20 family metallo-hydrolase [candidate division KSB1 bacterium]